MKRNKWLVWLGLFAAAVLLISMPGNHTEAEDAFEYARLAEEGGKAIFHGHHLLYLPLMTGVYKAINSLGFSVRAFPIMQGVSMVCGVVAVLLCFVIVERLAKNRLCALLSALGLLFSYGFWRYAVEVEIYVPAIALSLFLYWTVLRSSKTWHLALCGLLAGFAVLIHVINLIPAGAALLALLLRSWRDGGLAVQSSRPMTLHEGAREKSHRATEITELSAIGYQLPAISCQLLAYLVPAALLVGLAYGVVAAGPGIWLLDAPTQSLESGFRLTSIFKALVGFGQCLVSGNFLFCWPQFVEKLQAAFPYRYFAEEIFMAKHAFPFAAYAGLATLSLFAVCSLWFVVIAVRSLFTGDLCSPCGIGQSHQPQATRYKLFSVLRSLASDFCPLIFWLLGSAGMVFFVEAGNPELWVPVLAPLWLLLGLFVSRLSAACRHAFAVLVVVLGLHNAVGGMALIKSAKSDYNVQKASRILAEAKKGDVILTADTFVFSFYLDYWTDAEVLNLNTHSVELTDRGGRIFVLDDVFNPPVSMGVRYPGYRQKVAQAAEELRPMVTRIYSDSFGGACELRD